MSLSAKEKEWAYDQWCKGYTQEEVAEALFVCKKTVQRALRGRKKVKPVLVYPGFNPDYETSQPTSDSKTISSEEYCELVRETDELRQKLAWYEQAEAEGRLVICPEKLYDLMFDECSPEKAYITEYKTEGPFIAFAGDYIAPEEIGETIFLTREEAEQKLKAQIERAAQ